MKNIQEVRERVAKCTLCSLSQTRINAVPGKGSFTSDVVFVGEAPGRSEDKKGEPFVGAAGKKLSIALDSIGISRDEVYITNIVKCRPPENRVPMSNEVETCRNYLDMEIKIINPRVVCVLGNTAYRSLLEGNSISKDRGKIIKFKERLYFLTFHPAATIYNQGLFDIFCKDLRRLFDIANELKNGKKPIIDYEKSA